ncbi:MAG: phenylacetate--CoA ligase family protein [Candidatus Sumerlaeia bacterium]
MQPKIESADRESIRQMQLERLQATLNRAYRHVTLYREKFDEAGMLPEQIRSLEDLQNLPLTSREDLLDHQPYGLFAMALRDIVRIHPSAGAGGPIVVGYTQNDINVWARMAARALTSAGVTREDVIQISLDYAQNAAGMGAQSGAELLGASVIPSSGLAPKRQAEVMRLYRATVLVATPSQALHLGQYLGDVEKASLSLRSALIVGPVWSNELRSEIENLLHVEAFASYGLTEMAVPGLATGCEKHCGLHISEDNVLAEAVDPETGKAVAPGETGELVLTTLTREGVPMIRYRTGGTTVLHEEPCECGRSFARMELMEERTDDIVIVKGARVSPHQIEEVVHDILPNASCKLIVCGDDRSEDLEVRIGVDPTRFGDEIRHLQMLQEHIKAHIFEHLGLRAVIRLVEPDRPQAAPDGPPKFME